jgi:hypothetical protein
MPLLKRRVSEVWEIQKPGNLVRRKNTFCVVIAKDNRFVIRSLNIFNRSYTKEELAQMFNILEFSEAEDKRVNDWLYWNNNPSNEVAQEGDKKD